MKRLTIIVLSILCLLGLVGCQANDLNEPMYVPNLYPNANNIGSIGSPSQYWANGYFTSINGSTYPLNPVLMKLNEEAATYPNLPLSVSCVLEGYYSISGNYVDLSGNRNNGVVNVATWEQLASGLHSNYFNGNNSFINCGNASNLNVVNPTVVAWVCPQVGMGGYCTILEKRYTDSYWMGIDSSTTHFSAIFGGNVGALVGSTTITLNNWYFVCAIHNGTNDYLYVNGLQDGSVPDVTVIGDASNNVDVGAFSTGGQSWIGSITLARVYNRPLSATEISDIYNNEKGLFP